MLTGPVLLACQQGAVDTSAGEQPQRVYDDESDADAGTIGRTAGETLQVVDDPPPGSEPLSFGFDRSLVTNACDSGRETVLFDANALVPGSRFVGFGGDSALLAGVVDAVPHWHLLQMSSHEPDNFSVEPLVLPEAQGDLQIRDVWGTFVLACDGANCLVLELSRAGTLRPLAGHAPKDMVGLVGAHVSLDADSGEPLWSGATSEAGLATELCVFGDGLYCYQADALVQAMDGESLRDVALGWGHYAVSDAGKLWTRRSREEAWYELALPSAGEALIAVDASSVHVSVLGEHGAWYLAASDAPAFLTAQQEPALVDATLVFGVFGPYWVTLDNAGTVVLPPHAEQEGCRAGPFAQGLGLYQHACGSSLASLLVTEENILRVWGKLGCASVL